MKVGDAVLSYHGDLIYDAKILKTDTGAKGTQFFVHYQGWSKKWDEWVEKSRVMEKTPANEKKKDEAKRLMDEVKIQKKKKNKKSSSLSKRKHDDTSSTSSSGGGGGKNAAEKTMKKIKINAKEHTEDEIPSVRQVPIPMPFTLKKQLVDDWKNVTRPPFQRVSLPRKPTANQILQQYLDFKKLKAKGSSEVELKNIQEIIDGIRVYFDRALGIILLYRTERKQYDQIKEKYPDTPISDIYGAEHLLRLFVRLPLLLGHTSMSESEGSQIQSKLGDFLKFMQKNHSTWFLTEYEDVPESELIVEENEDIEKSEKKKVETKNSEEVDEVEKSVEEIEQHTDGKKEQQKGSFSNESEISKVQTEDSKSDLEKK